VLSPNDEFAIRARREGEPETSTEAARAERISGNDIGSSNRTIICTIRELGVELGVAYCLTDAVVGWWS
jgi:hypothetical protein